MSFLVPPQRPAVLLVGPNPQIREYIATNHDDFALLLLSPDGVLVVSNFAVLSA